MNRLDDDHQARLDEADALLWQVFRSLAFAAGVLGLVAFWNWIAEVLH